MEGSRVPAAQPHPEILKVTPPPGAIPIPFKRCLFEVSKSFSLLNVSTRFIVISGSNMETNHPINDFPGSLERVRITETWHQYYTLAMGFILCFIMVARYGVPFQTMIELLFKLAISSFKFDTYGGGFWS